MIIDGNVLLAQKDPQAVHIEARKKGELAQENEVRMDGDIGPAEFRRKIVDVQLTAADEFRSNSGCK
jgi:hypothetical protein